MAEFCCPNCGSENIQKIQLVYQSGANSHSRVTTYENKAGYSIEAETNERNITDLAASVAPPEEKETNFTTMLVCGGIAAFIIYDALFLGGNWTLFRMALIAIFGILSIGAYLSSVENIKWNKNEYPKLYQEWTNSFICHKCGHRFIIQ